SRRRHTRSKRDWSSDVCSSDLGQKYRKSFFIIELPEYKVPSLKRACGSMLERGKAYIVKAGTIILVCNTIVQIMQSFNWQFQLVEEGAEGTSILASIAHPFAILFIPLGFGVWQLAAAAVTGFIAKENVVGTLAVVYGVTNFIDVRSEERRVGKECRCRWSWYDARDKKSKEA